VAGFGREAKMRVTMKRRLEAHEGWMIAAPERDLPANMRAWFNPEEGESVGRQPGACLRR
jgi:hypothetical protein